MTDVKTRGNGVNTRKRLRAVAALLVGLLAVGVLPATTSQAAVPSSVDTVRWELRQSWVNYLTNPAWALWVPSGQGKITLTSANGGAPVAVGSTNTTWGSSYVNYHYTYDLAVASDAGSPRTVTLEGGFDFDLNAHSIDVSLTNFRIVEDTATGKPEAIVADGSYKPLFASAVTVDGDQDGAAFVLAESPTSGRYEVTLTELGARFFNGGDNGSYSEGDNFGWITYP